MMLLHPREATLLRYAAGSAQETARRRVASHLADCDRCRSTVQSTREIRVALASGAAVGAPDLLLQRILQSRMQGERVILPAETPAPRVTFATPNTPATTARTRPVYWLLLGGVAAIGVVQVGSTMFENAMLRNAGVVTGSEAHRPIVTDAERRQQLIRERSIPAAGPIVASRLRPVTLKYGYVSYSGTTPYESGGGSTYQIVRNPSNSNEWILITTRDARYFKMRGPDSIWINGQTLEPTHWNERFTNYGARIENSYWVSNGQMRHVRRVALLPGTSANDSLRPRREKYYRPTDTTFMLSEQGGFATRVQNQAHFIATMMAIPLELGWRGRFTSSGCCDFAGPGTSGKLVITGSHTAITPAGVFECWEAAERYGAGFRLRWFRKTDGVFVGESAGDVNGMSRSQTLLVAEE